MDLISLDGTLSLETKNKIVELEKQAKAIKEEQDKMRVAILEEMEKRGIVKLDSEELSITYKAPTYKESFDSKELKKDNEELYNKYIKISPVKSSILIKVK